MRWRLEISGALYRHARDKAGDDHALAVLVRTYLTQYVEGTSAQALGGHARAAQMTSEARSASARHAALSRHRRT